jgi:hypothetical protein
LLHFEEKTKLIFNALYTKTWLIFVALYTKTWKIFCCTNFTQNMNNCCFTFNQIHKKNLHFKHKMYTFFLVACTLHTNWTEGGTRTGFNVNRTHSDLDWNRAQVIHDLNSSLHTSQYRRTWQTLVHLNPTPVWSTPKHQKDNNTRLFRKTVYTVIKLSCPLSWFAVGKQTKIKRMFSYVSCLVLFTGVALSNPTISACAWLCCKIIYVKTTDEK